MEGFDLSSYVKASTEKSGVTLKVSEPSTLLSIASQLNSTVSNYGQDVSTRTNRLARLSVPRPTDRGVPRAPKQSA